jgi:hypothetical protein
LNGSAAPEGLVFRHEHRYIAPPRKNRRQGLHKRLAASPSAPSGEGNIDILFDTDGLIKLGNLELPGHPAAMRRSTR